jgi:hypothetical protein
VPELQSGADDIIATVIPCASTVSTFDRRRVGVDCVCVRKRARDTRRTGGRSTSGL